MTKAATRSTAVVAAAGTIAGGSTTGGAGGAALPLSMKAVVMDDTVMDDINNEEISEFFDSVCAICDNGGCLLCCDGICKRSFHPTIKDGVDSKCASLCLSKSEVKAIDKFFCKNCTHKQHQCFACSELGSSDPADQTVFQCSDKTCGHFYHPKCVADILFSSNDIESLECQRKIVEGQSFTCPVHKCLVCGDEENKEKRQLQFAICRRCPTTYHRKCLPRKISFKGRMPRAWDDVLPDRILIYCLKHDLDSQLHTPIRNHILFPRDSKMKSLLNVQKTKEEVVRKNNPTSSVPRKRAKKAENVSRSEVRDMALNASQSVWDIVREIQNEFENTATASQTMCGENDISYPKTDGEREK